MRSLNSVGMEITARRKLDIQFHRGEPPETGGQQTDVAEEEEVEVRNSPPLPRP